MNRSEFIQILWKRFFKPAFLAVLIIYGIRFIYFAFKSNSDERLLILIAVSIFGILLIISLLNLLFVSVLDKLKKVLPEKFQNMFIIALRIVNFMLPFAAGAYMYYLIQQEFYTGVILVCIFLILSVHDIVLSFKKEIQNKQVT